MADNEDEIELDEAEIDEAEIDEDIETDELDEDDGLVELIDEDGNELKFKLLDVTEYKGEKYALLLAAEPNDLIADDEVVIFRLNEAEQTLEPVDGELLQEVFNAYLARVNRGN